jgi:hypothetical protein
MSSLSLTGKRDFLTSHASIKQTRNTQHLQQSPFHDDVGWITFILHSYFQKVKPLFQLETAQVRLCHSGSKLQSHESESQVCWVKVYVNEAQLEFGSDVYRMMSDGNVAHLEGLKVPDSFIH